MNCVCVTSRTCSLTPRVGRRLVALGSDSESRATKGPLGFTLIELLVVVAVLLILIVMTVSVLDFTFTSERVRSASRQMQSALEGARDRAIFAGKPRGLRLLVDPTDPRIVTSMVYVGEEIDWDVGRAEVRLERKDFEEDTNNNGQLDSGEDTNGNGRLDGNGSPDSPDVLIVRGGSSCGWNTLKERGFLNDSLLIYLGDANNGEWYQVLTYRLSASNPVLELDSPYQGPIQDQTGVIASPAGITPYSLKLPSRILPDAQPILLPDGICIDLDGSNVPTNWRPGIPGSVISLEAQYKMPYSAKMEIMFSSRGVVTGPLAALGLVHLYVAERKDVVYATDMGVTGSTVGTAAPRRPPAFRGDPFRVPGQNQFDADNSIGQRLVTSIFTQTGKVSSHQIDATDSNSDGYADNPFLYATQGKAPTQ